MDPHPDEEVAKALEADGCPNQDSGQRESTDLDSENLKVIRNDRGSRGLAGKCDNAVVCGGVNQESRVRPFSAQETTVLDNVEESVVELVKQNKCELDVGDLPLPGTDIPGDVKLDILELLRGGREPRQLASNRNLLEKSLCPVMVGGKGTLCSAEQLLVLNLVLCGRHPCRPAATSPNPTLTHSGKGEDNRHCAAAAAADTDADRSNPFPPTPPLLWVKKLVVVVGCCPHWQKPYMAPSWRSSPDGHSTTNGNAEKKQPADVNWDELGFSLTPTDYMYVMRCGSGESCFSEGTLLPFGNIEMNPCSTILNYGQGLFEGLKAYRKEDGKLLLFRPEQNALRMIAGADRLCMPSPAVEQFIDAVKQTVLANERWVPPVGKGSMYVRPLLMGTSASLGLGPASEYTFLVYASPVGIYHKGHATLNLVVEEEHHRAIPGGTGGVKTVANYSPVLKALTRAKAKGFSDVLFSDAATGKYVDEASACNLFAVKGMVISTPPDHGTILPGITRKSILEIALALGYQVEERQVSIEEMLDADEVFCTGTAVVVTPVGSITYKGKRTEYGAKVDGVCQKLHTRLTGIQTGQIEDTMGWTVALN
ncbi:hypothetical protein MLD38_032146 [Melastoma candidum]|uniref:Uncharacterized protein n=1 Tax=Melastoma candidum TaxID=119954 RepID=A0ACB9M316_9MYRT|nr:hypothetical protein MLD38_032146 [Melastoma candidum]